MLRASKSLTQPRLLQVMLWSIVINGALLIGLTVGLYHLLQMLPYVSEWGWMGDAGFSVLAVVLALFLFPMLLPLILMLFFSSMVERIEQTEFPQLPQTVPPYWPSVAQDIGFVIKTILLNILVLPLYLIPLVNVITYYLLNGHLLNTEIFNIVAGRHMQRDEAKKLKANSDGEFFVAGALFAFLLTLPIVNLVAPLWGVALIVHLFHARKPAYKAVTYQA